MAEDVNPLCGDRVRMMLRVQDGLVAAARFAGDSCAICTASADVVAESVVGKTVAEATKLTTEDVLADAAGRRAAHAAALRGAAPDRAPAGA